MVKLVTFVADGGVEVGLVRGQGVVSLTRAAPSLATDMIDLIARWDERAAAVQQLADSAPEHFRLDQVRLAPPIPRPGKILAIGLNYADHIAETGQPTPAHQVWFCKQPTAANGPFDPIRLPKVSSRVDYEVELVAVIGRACRHVEPADAAAVVFGYCVGNDITARDWQFQTPQWMLGKSFDTHAPFGPWITTRDEVGDPHGLGIRCSVNGELRQESDTGRLVFNVWDQIAHLSKVMTLEPGDLIFTGTPGGVGMAMRPPCLLAPGDRVRAEIDGLGAIEAMCEPE